MKNKNLIGIFIYLPMILQFTMFLDYPMAPIVRGIQFVIVLYFIVKNISKRKYYSIEEMLILSLFILYVIISMFTAYKSKIPLTVMKRIFTILIPNILLVFIVYLDENPKESFIRFIRINVFMGIFFSIYGTILSIFGEWGYLKVHELQIQELRMGPIRLIQSIHGSTEPYRISSFFNNPNSFGIFLVLTMLSTIYLFKTQNINKYKFILFFSIQFIGILLTQSRTAFLTFATSIMLFLFIASKKKIRFLLVSILSAFIGLFILKFNYLNLDISIINRFQNLNLSGREGVWKVLIDSISENYIFGIGFSTSYEAILLENTDVNHTHNLYLKLISETGFIGFVSFMLLWVVSIIIAIKQMLDSKFNKDQYIYAYILSILLSFMIHVLAEELLLRYNYIMLIWTYLISLSAINLSRDKVID